MSDLALSPRINLEQSRKQAKDLVKAFREGDPKVLDRVRWNHPRFHRLSDDEIKKREFKLADAQLVLARMHSFESWPRLLEHIETLRKRDPQVLRFEAAADAIVSGDIPTLRKMLGENPDLIHARSSRHQRAPLLHYIAANGVENYRQISPPNVVEAGKVLLDAGAEVDAVSEAYGGGSTALGLVATSTPPRIAGVQIPLIDLLLEYGAAIDGVKPGASIVFGAFANGCPEAARHLVERGARVDTVVVAAALGRLDLVREHAQHATKEDLEKALIMGAQFGGVDVVEYLLDNGVDIAASDGMTALHQAAGRADVALVSFLISRGAPLEKKNIFGGTVLDSTVWFAYNVNSFDRANRDYAAVIDVLLAAGAKADLYPEMQKQIGEIYSRAGRALGMLKVVQLPDAK